MDSFLVALPERDAEKTIVDIGVVLDLVVQGEWLNVPIYVESLVFFSWDCAIVTLVQVDSALAEVQVCLWSLEDRQLVI